MDLLFNVTSFYAHTKANPCLISGPLCLSREGSESSAGPDRELTNSVCAVGRCYSAPTLEPGRPSSVCACVCVCVCIFFLSATGPDPPFTAHWLNALPGQPQQLLCYATYQTDTCRRNYGMSAARINPNGKKRETVGAKFQRSNVSIWGTLLKRVLSGRTGED